MKLFAHTCVLIALVAFFAYLPISSFLFAIKNDAFIGYFPVKYFMSESLKAGYIPWWNPYLNYGLPQYADMSSAFWNPLGFLIAVTIGYNPYSFTLEELIYLFLSGYFMYRLCGFWKMNKPVKLIAALSYMCCGYMVGHLQHFNWISGAAWLPLCLLSYLQFWNSPSLKTVLLTGLSFYLFSSAAHPGILIGALYFFLLIVLFQIISAYRRMSQTRTQIIKMVSWHSVLLLLFGLLALGMILSYAEVLPFMDRGEKISLAASQVGPTALLNWISLCLPFSITTTNSWLNNDVALRNVYLGLLMLAFFVYSIFSPRNRWQNTFLFSGLLFFLLSLGGFIKTIAYTILPLSGFVRLDGEFRIFAILCWILAGAISLNNFMNEGWNPDARLKRIFTGLKLIFSIAGIVGLIGIISSTSGIFKSFPPLREGLPMADYLKMIVDGLQFQDTIFIQSIIQLTFIILLWRALKIKSIKLLVSVTAAELILATLLNLPFTGVGKSSLAGIDGLIQNAPSGIPVPDLLPVNSHSKISPGDEKKIGNWGFYSRQIGMPDYMGYPVLLKSTRRFYQSEHKSKIDSLPFIYLDPAMPKIRSH